MDPHDQRISRLASSLSRSSLLKTLVSIRDHLHEVCRYRHDPLETNSPVGDFLFGSHTGNCQHFSAAPVLLLRVLGYEARVAVGYGSTAQALYDSDAHAWIEVRFADIGWVPYDLTDGAATEDTEEDSDEAQPLDDESLEEDVEEIDDEEGSGEDFSGLESLNSQPPILVVYAQQYESVRPWATQFAALLRRVLEERVRPRDRGAFESGRNLNTSSLYKIATGDPRIMRRRSRISPVPIHFSMAYDESGSVNIFQGNQADTWKRLRYQLAMGLHLADQDFAWIGFGRTLQIYKTFGQPMDDHIRNQAIALSASRASNAEHNGATRTWLAVESLRELHEKHIPGRKSYGLVVTDGVPTDGPIRSYEVNSPSQEFLRKKVRKEVELAHDQGLNIISLVLLERNQRRYNEKSLLRGLDDMFDRSLVLDDEPTVVDQQIMSLLSSLARS